MCDGIPVTSVAQTLIDIAAVVSLDLLRYAWDDAERLKLFDRDPVRDVKLQLLGYKTMRITYRRLANQPDEVARDLRALLAA